MNFDIVDRGDLHVCLWTHTKKDPPKEEFDAACSRILALRNEKPGSVTRFRAIIISDGGGPNMTQRTQHNVATLGSHRVPTSLVSCALTNPIARGIVKAVTWTNPGFKPFAPHQWIEALKYVGLENDPVVFRELQRLAQSLPESNKTLSAIATILKPPRDP